MGDSYPKFIIKSPCLLPPSRLSNLKPIGIGTPMVESLVSYIYRLAMAHCWTLNTLFEFEILPLLNIPNIRRRKRSQHMAASVLGKAQRWFERINGASETTAKLTAAIECLTLRDDISFLSFLPWCNIFSPENLTRKYKAWCPDCYSEWRASGNLIYEPLLWTVHAVQICVRHQIYLTHLCPNCNENLQWLSARSFPGYCSKCSGWLGVSGNNSGKQGALLKGSKLESHSWIANNVGQLLAASSNQRRKSTQENVVRSLSICIENICKGIPNRFAKIIGKPKSTLWGWTHHKTKLSLIDLLRICYCTGPSLLDFLTRDFDPTLLPVPKAPLAELGHSTRRYLRKPLINQNDIMQRLHNFLDEKTKPVSMQKVAGILKQDERTLRHKYPEICRQISKRFLNFTSKCSKDKWDKLDEEILGVVLQLHNTGQRISRRNIAALLNKPEYIGTSKILDSIQLAKHRLDI